MPPAHPPRTRGELEAEIGRAVIQFEKDSTGRGPVETRVYILHDMILVRLRGALTVAEQCLAARDGRRARYLVKQMRQELLERGRGFFDGVLARVVNARARAVLADVSTRTGERVIAFILDAPPA